VSRQGWICICFARFGVAFGVNSLSPDTWLRLLPVCKVPVTLFFNFISCQVLFAKFISSQQGFYRCAPWSSVR
jgi:hypothetical protein